MSSSILLEKLIDIERSIGIDAESTIRRKVLEAQDYLLQTSGVLRDPMQPAADEPTPPRYALLRAFSLKSIGY